MPSRLFFSIILAFFATVSVVAAAGIGGSGNTALIMTGVPPAPADLAANNTRWKLLNIDKRIAIVKHSIDSKDSREGAASEYVSMAFPKKTDLFFGREIDFPCLIEDLSPSVWVKSNQAGLTLGAQIVLPRETNPNTGRPITFLITGARYSKVGDWQKLDFSSPNLYKLAQQTAQNLRGELEYKLDFSNMYVRQLILYVEGLPNPDNRPSEKKLWIGETKVDGCAPIWGVLGKESKEFGRLEPECAAYWFELDQLEQQEYAKQTNPSQDEADSEEETEPKSEGFPKTASPVYQIQRIEMVGSSSPKGPAKTVEDLASRGFKPKFDPVNMSGFLAKTVSGPVFSKHTTEYETGQVVWDLTSNSGRRLEDPYNVELKKKLNGQDDGMMRMDPTQSIHLVNYNERRLQEPNYADATETVYYSDGAQEVTRNQLPVQTIKLEGQMIRLFDQNEGVKKSLGIRAIEYRGEPLEFLRSMRFNTIWLSSTPSRELLEEAMRKQFWIICPPPAEIGVERPDAHGTSAYDRIAPTPAEYQNVLCWNLGEYLVKPSVSEIELRARKIQAADRNARQGRPFICSIESGGLDFSSKIQDLIVMMRREPLLTSLDLVEYGAWLKDYEKKLLPSTPRWTAVQTQPDANLVAQWDLFGGHREQPVVVSVDQMRLMVRQAIAAGSHGLLFTSQTPLTDQNPETEYRVKALALLNLELMLIEEWFAEGTVIGHYESNHPQLSGVLLYLDRARLLLPLWNEVNSQYAMGQAAVTGGTEFKVSIPETYDKLLLTPGVFERVPAERVAGGTRLRINDASMTSMIFMTENVSFRGRIETRARDYGPTMVQLALDLARMRLESDEKTFQMLKQAADSRTIPTLASDNNPLVRFPEQETLLKMTREDIARGEDLFKRNDFSHAYLQAELATRGIRGEERDMWYVATRSDSNRSLTPVSTGFTTIPFYISMYNNFRTATQGQEMLLYGDFECPLANWKAVGWRHEQHQWEKDITSHARFVSEDPRPGSTGSRNLRLYVESSKPESNLQVETAPIWITTPAIPVNTGQLLCVSGWINIRERIKGSADGLIIWDSIGGDPLALRFYQTNGWRQFAFFRYAPSDGLFETRFYLSGIGEAWIDDISIRPVLFGTAPEVPLEQPAPTPPTRWLNPSILNPLQYLPGRQQEQPAN